MYQRHACLLVLALLAGCDEPAAPPVADTAPRPEIGQRFDAKSTGRVAGRVVWTGPRPVVPPLRSIIDPLTDQPPPPPRDWANPNAPVIADDGGVASAVVFLRGIDVARSKPWHYDPVSVELADHRFVIHQGKNKARVGFARAGDRVEFVSRQPLLHVAQARGAGFFSLTLPEPDRPRARPLTTPGVVELTSGAGFFWMRAYLHVDHHPYYALTDEKGQFQLDDVPDGDYEVVAWHPNWRIAREERNPDSARVQQARFAERLALTRRARVEPGAASRLDLDLSSLLH